MAKRHFAKVAAIAVSALMATTCAASLASCGDDEIPEADLKEGTYRTYTSVMPSNWNELTYEDNNDTQILSYIVSPFFEYDYEFDESKGGKYNDDGTINADAIVSGGFTVDYAAATKLEDVTATVDAKWGYTDEQKESGGYAYKITLRDDLKWDDGTAIDASDFVYTMQEQLNPLFQNMRASTYYNNIQIIGARDRVYSGQSVWNDGTNSDGECSFTLSDLVKGEDGTYTWEGNDLHFALTSNLNWLGGSATLTQYVTSYSSYFNTEHWADLQALADASGYVPVNDTTISYMASLISTEMWGEDEENVVNYMEYYYTYPEFDYSGVGYYQEGKYELVICMSSPIQMLKEDGSLSYEAAYSFSGMPLVKKDLYESCKQEPEAGSTLWTTTYNTSLETTASWGPYKLTSFQLDKSYTLTKNENWFGYGMDEYKNQYNVTAIECEQITETATTWTKFLAGEIDDIGLDVTHKDDYRNSKYTVYTPGTGTYGIQLYSNLAVLNENGRNNSVMAIDAFREAFALYLDRDELNSTLYTSHRSCYGLMGPAYYYDVENGGVYRNTQIAKEGLLRAYGFTEIGDGTWSDGTNTYADYQEAYDAMNGMNRTKSKELLEEAYTELTTSAEKYNYDSSKKITFVYGTSADNENTRRGYDYLVKVFEEMTAGTSFEGKIELTFDSSFGSNWAKDFKSGAYEIANGTGFSGGAFDPEGMLQCYVDPNAGLMYATWWDTSSDMVTYTMPEGDYSESGKTLTMSVYNWYCCLNGIAESYEQPYTYNWGSGFVDEDVRLQVLSMLEETILGKYYTIITTSSYSATVVGAKFSYVSDEYNTFMYFGGLRYMIVNYTDAEWTEYVSSQGGDLSTEYKKTA